MGEVGWNTWEEVDHGPAGTNFGWPCYEGNGPQPFFQANFAGAVRPDRPGDSAVLHLRPQHSAPR